MHFKTTKNLLLFLSNFQIVSSLVRDGDTIKVWINANMNQRERSLIPHSIHVLAREREKARDANNFHEARKIEKLVRPKYGYIPSPGGKVLARNYYIRLRYLIICFFLK